MTDIIVRMGDRELRFPREQTVSIGRALESTIICAGDTVSAEHATLAVEHDQWVFRDISRHGSFVNGTQATAFTIAEPVRVQLGDVISGPVLDLVPDTAETTTAADPTAAADPVAATSRPTPQYQATQIVPKELRGAAVTGVAPSGSDLTIQHDGGEFVAHPGQVVSVGRDPSNDIVLDKPTVSRNHARIWLGKDGWVVEDLGSSRGLTVDGKPVAQVTLSGTSDVWFGPEEAGVRVIFVAPGRSRKKEENHLNPLFVLLPILAVTIVAIIAVVVLRSSDTTTVVAVAPLGGAGPAATTATAAPPAGYLDLVALKKATVRIEGRFQLSAAQRRRVDDAKKEKGLDTTAPDLTGSGTIISADGLILTNAHVATPDKVTEQGADTLPPLESLKVALNLAGSDEALTATETAEVVVSDPKLDLAVIRIKGHPDLPAAPIGNDHGVKAGDALVVLGFPGIAGTDGVNVTRGVASSFVADKNLDTDRAWINTDAKIDPGNSGGLAANSDGKIIGIPTIVCFRPFGSSSASGPVSQQNRIRAIDLAAPIIAAAKTGGTYDPVSVDPQTC